MKFMCDRLAPVLLLMLPAMLAADELQQLETAVDVVPARIYSTPEERREAGMGTGVTEWLTVSGLLEIESERSRENYRGRPDRETGETEETLQLGAHITVSEAVSSDLVFDYEVETGTSIMDESAINFESGPWGASAGRLYVPFGEYFSFFVTGPLVEFGETRVTAATLDYSWHDRAEVFAYVFDSEVDTTGGDDEGFDWGAGLELSSTDDAIKAGVSYISDLAESGSGLLDDVDEHYSSRVGGWNAYTMYGMASAVITAEVVAADGKFSGLDAAEDEPLAANVELAWFPDPVYQIAARVEYSDELADEPGWQYGISVAWRIGRHVSLAADYLYGEYRNGFVTDDDDNELRDHHVFAALLGLEF